MLTVLFRWWRVTVVHQVCGSVLFSQAQHSPFDAEAPPVSPLPLRCQDGITSPAPSSPAHGCQTLSLPLLLLYLQHTCKYSCCRYTIPDMNTQWWTSDNRGVQNPSPYSAIYKIIGLYLWVLCTKFVRGVLRGRRSESAHPYTCFTSDRLRRNVQGV
jgi:hypothetical protein